MACGGASVLSFILIAAACTSPADGGAPAGGAGPGGGAPVTSTSTTGGGGSGGDLTTANGGGGSEQGGAQVGGAGVGGGGEGGTGGGAQGATCGNGALEAIDVGFEECDDANLLNGDGCADDCKIEPGAFCVQSSGPTYCGPFGDCATPDALYPGAELVWPSCHLRFDSVQLSHETCATPPGGSGHDIVYSFTTAAPNQAVRIMYPTGVTSAQDAPRVLVTGGACDTDAPCLPVEHVPPSPVPTCEDPSSGWFFVAPTAGTYFVVLEDLPPFPCPQQGTQPNERRFGWFMGQSAIGDGSVAGSGERCDDGNVVDGDGCSSLAKPESIGTSCADPIVVGAGGVDVRYGQIGDHPQASIQLAGHAGCSQPGSSGRGTIFRVDMIAGETFTATGALVHIFQPGTCLEACVASGTGSATHTASVDGPVYVAIERLPDWCNAHMVIERQ